MPFTEIELPTAPAIVIVLGSPNPLGAVEVGVTVGVNVLVGVGVNVGVIDGV